MYLNMEEEPLICNSCMYFNTDECPHKDIVIALTYVELDNHYLTKEEKKESWVRCDKYFD